MKPKTYLVAYDGHCGLCHGWVKFVLKHDKKAQFQFTPLQSEYFKGIAKKHKKPFPDSIIVFDNEQFHLRSSAVVFILRRLGFGWKLVGSALWIIPKFLRDWGYSLVAGVRRKIWKTPDDTCPIVPKELRDRFL